MDRNIIYKVKDVEAVSKKLIYEEFCDEITFDEAVSIIEEDPHFLRDHPDEDFCRDEYVIAMATTENGAVKSLSKTFIYSLRLQYIIAEAQIKAYEIGRKVIKNLLYAGYYQLKNEVNFAKFKTKKAKDYVLSLWDKLFDKLEFAKDKNVKLLTPYSDQYNGYFTSIDFPNSFDVDLQYQKGIASQGGKSVDDFQIYRRVEKKDETEFKTELCDALLDSALTTLISMCFESEFTMKDVYELYKADIEIPKSFDKTK